VTRAGNVFSPTSAPAGVPERVPSNPTLSQAGPPSFVKARLSGVLVSVTNAASEAV
jgi:hypothetical protein